MVIQGLVGHPSYPTFHFDMFHGVCIKYATKLNSCTGMHGNDHSSYMFNCSCGLFGWESVCGPILGRGTQQFIHDFSRFAMLPASHHTLPNTTTKTTKSRTNSVWVTINLIRCSVSYFATKIDKICDATQSTSNTTAFILCTSHLSQNDTRRCAITSYIRHIAS